MELVDYYCGLPGGHVQTRERSCQGDNYPYAQKL